MLPKLLMDGAWARCLKCTKALGSSLHSAAIGDDKRALRSQALAVGKAANSTMETLKCVVCKQDKLRDDYHEAVWKWKRQRLHQRCRDFFWCPTCAPGTKHALSDFAFGAKTCDA